MIAVAESGTPQPLGALCRRTLRDEVRGRAAPHPVVASRGAVGYGRDLVRGGEAVHEAARRHGREDLVERRRMGARVVVQNYPHRLSRGERSVHRVAQVDEERLVRLVEDVAGDGHDKELIGHARVEGQRRRRRDVIGPRGRRPVLCRHLHRHRLRDGSGQGHDERQIFRAGAPFRDRSAADGDAGIVAETTCVRTRSWPESLIARIGGRDQVTSRP